MQLNELFFKLSLLDNVTGAAGKIQKKLDGLAGTARKSFRQIGYGAAGMWGAGKGMMSLVDPARQMQRALGEVGSLGVAGKSLDQLNRQALAFSIQYGGTAADVAASAYDIQSSISGLDGSELASFTNASNVLAKATKADAGTITDYTGTMYGIFKSQADKMGKAKWVEQLAGKTATAVQMFKTTGMEMSSAFTSIGANATSAGIAASEQMAVLGTLQSTMSGSEAGTKYKAFLSGVGQAQSKLGLRFTDSQGKMLGIMDILGKLKKKFGDTLDVNESDTLKKAFGSDEAVSMVKLLMADTTGLGESINKLGQVTGMDKARKMARSMVDPFDRLAAGGRALSIVMGQALLPVINPIVDGFANLSARMVGWSEKFPNITKWIGYGATAILGFTAVLGLASVASGVMRVATFGLSTVFSPLTGVLGLVRKAWTAYTGCQWLANAALWGFPGTWLVGALVGVVAAVGAVIYWWDDLKAAFLDTSWGKAIAGAFGTVANWFATLYSLAGKALGGIGTIWTRITSVFTDFSWSKAIGVAFDGIFFWFKLLGGLPLRMIGLVFDGWQKLFGILADTSWGQAIIGTASGVWTFITDLFGGIGAMWNSVTGAFTDTSWLTSWGEGLMGVIGGVLDWFRSLGGVVDWVLDKLDWLPGVDLKATATASTPPPVTSEMLDAPRRTRIPTGGVTQQISKAVTQNQSATHSIGKVVINTEGKQDGQSIRQELLMAGA
ncbi:MAG: phage tail tape measure protein [Desulfovibrio sp.]|uniref:phage tail tape measure protein n=1 Tax=Desulfovibrio sp. 7SRBS1 TaxID=3378064 RepID=UPI003B3D843C